jgi:hypothetical protein
MNWFKKAKLEEEWWKKWTHHLPSIINLEFEKTNSCPQAGNNISICPGGYKTSFGQYNINLDYKLTAKNHMYFTTVSLYFDRYIANLVSYTRHQVKGVENLEANLTGCKIYILRDAGSGIGRGIGPVEFAPQETTPYNIVKTIKEMIDADKDDDNENEPLLEPEPTPGIRTPVLV